MKPETFTDKLARRNDDRARKNRGSMSVDRAAQMMAAAVVAAVAGIEVREAPSPALPGMGARHGE